MVLSRGTDTSFISPKGMKVLCRVASVTLSSSPPTYSVVFALVPLPPTATFVVCMPLLQPALRLLLPDRSLLPSVRALAHLQQQRSGMKDQGAYRSIKSDCRRTQYINGMPWAPWLQ